MSKKRRQVLEVTKLSSNFIPNERKKCERLAYKTKEGTFFIQET